MNGYCMSQHYYNTMLKEEQQELKDKLETLARDHYHFYHLTKEKIKKINCRTNTNNTIKSLIELYDELSIRNQYFNDITELNKTT
jgi:hypothetical protein